MTVIINGTTGIDTVQDGIVTDAKLNLTANSQEIKDAINATGSADIYACRAWVNFNGTGTVAIRASGNVSPITDNNTGDYTVNFTTAMPDANYSSSAMTNTYFGLASNDAAAPTTSQFRFIIRQSQSPATAIDASIISLAFFR